MKVIGNEQIRTAIISFANSGLTIRLHCLAGWAELELLVYELRILEKEIFRIYKGYK